MKFTSFISLLFKSSLHSRQQDLLKVLLVLEAASLTAATLALAETRVGLI